MVDTRPVQKQKIAVFKAVDFHTCFFQRREYLSITSCATGSVFQPTEMTSLPYLHCPMTDSEAMLLLPKDRPSFFLVHNVTPSREPQDTLPSNRKEGDPLESHLKTPESQAYLRSGGRKKDGSTTCSSR